MTTQLRIAVLYSYGPHFMRAVRGARHRYPDGHITALLPPSFPEDLLSASVDAVLRCVPEPDQKRTLSDAVRLVRTLRTARFDVLVLLYNSPKLQVLATLSGAAERYCHGMDGRVTPVRLRLVGLLARQLMHAIRGRCRYCVIWMHVHAFPVRHRNKQLLFNKTDPKP